MTPEQAVAAAAAMGARQIVPIHYGLFDNPPRYTAIADAEERLLNAAAQRDIPVALAPLGEQFRVPSPTADTTRTPA
jgi:L-ascorbate metabolism protein UlaG (beta-lactamase superfamily)